MPSTWREARVDKILFEPTVSPFHGLPWRYYLGLLKSVGNQEDDGLSVALGQRRVRLACQRLWVRTALGMVIGSDIRVTIVEYRGGQVRLGIDAPKNVTILRSELNGSGATPG